MAGTPKFQLLCKAIEECGGEEYIWERVADGDSMKTIAQSLGFSRGLLYKWINRDKERRRAKLKEARELSADAHAEDAGEVLDDLSEQPGVTSAEVQLANARANYRKWLAGVRNREEYGERQQAGITVNVGSLHLDALRAAGSMELSPPSADGDGEPELLEAEVVDAEAEAEDRHYRRKEWLEREVEEDEAVDAADEFEAEVPDDDVDELVELVG